MALTTRAHPVQPVLRAGVASALCVVLCMLIAAGASAQVRTAFPAERGLSARDFPRVIELSPGVYGYEALREPGFTTVSLFVVGERGVLLADGQGDPAAMQRLLGAIASVTAKPLRWYVVGSDHVDHTGGNSVLPADVEYIVHRTSRQQLAADAARKGPAAPPIIVPKAAMATDHRVIDIGGRQVHVLHLGRAHTGGDLLVHLPPERILFMSEVFLNRVFPALRSAYPAEWLAVIDAALRMPIDRFVPGHGFIESPAASREQLQEFRAALSAVTAEARRLRRLGLSVERALAQARWGAYATWMLADSQGIVALRRVFAEDE